ncbi:MAG TPA: hypothetical protein PKY82_28595 [Pyrinomonadaceae bacterium]|nr:hypothetical protein [Pyrinomonadaceae bacterium]
MKSKTFNLIRPFILIGVFFAISFVAGRILHPIWAESRFVSIGNSNADQTNVLVFTPDNVEVIQYGNLDEYLREHQDYSFLLPTDKIEIYHTKLVENSQKSNLKNQVSLNVEQISNNRQSIELRIDGNRRNSVTRYEATDKEIFLKTSLTENLFTEFPFLLIVISIGFVCALLTRFVLKKSINLSKLM